MVERGLDLLQALMKGFPSTEEMVLLRSAFIRGRSVRRAEEMPASA
jgi:hypothetical protein